MRILMLALDVDLRQQRGDSTHTLNLAKALQRLGHPVTLIVARGFATKVGDGTGVDAHEVAEAGNLSVLRRCIKIGRMSGAEVIYERRYSPKISYAVANRLRIPYLVEVNGILEDELTSLGRAKVSGGSFSQLRFAARGHFLRRADAVVAVSEGIKRYLLRAHSLKTSQVRVIPNGVDADLFAPCDSMASRRRVGLPDDSKIVTFVGNFVPWQGLMTLVRASPNVLAAQPNAQFVLVGEGPIREALRVATVDLRVSTAFHLPGSVAYTDVPIWIAAADACVAPFTWERNARAELSPLKVFEYMACARPVVATDIPGVAELVRETHAGMLVPPDDPEALAEGISGLLMDSAKCIEMGRRGRRAVVEGYTWAHTASRVEDVLEEVVA